LPIALVLAVIWAIAQATEACTPIKIGHVVSIGGCQ